MKTLPTNMLKHTAELQAPSGVGGWRDTEYGQAVELTRVHVQRERALGETGGLRADMEIRPSARLWYDARVSQPHGLDFIALQREAEAAGSYLRVTHGGIAYRVTRAVELLDGFGRVHHYELELI